MSARDDYPFGELTASGTNTILPIARWSEMCNEIDRLREALDPPFPPHTGAGPDVNPATGDERETTTGPATDGPWDGPDDDEPAAA